jgi:hypothetical protein
MIAINFKEWLINEIFDTPSPIKWLKRTATDWKGVFFVGPPNARKRYSIAMIRDYGMPWEVTFDLLNMEKKTKTQAITGTGYAGQVFASVLNGIKEWQRQVNPDAFALSAREPSRHSLYAKMLDVLLQPKKNWTVEDYGATFFVSKKGASVYAGFGDNEFDNYYDD